MNIFHLLFDVCLTEIDTVRIYLRILFRGCDVGFDDSRNGISVDGTGNLETVVLERDVMSEPHGQHFFFPPHLTSERYGCALQHPHGVHFGEDGHV